MPRVIIAAVILAASLCGCATVDKQLANRAAITLDGQDVLISSMWGERFGFTYTLYRTDAQAIIASQRAAMAAAAARPASAP